MRSLDKLINSANDVNGVSVSIGIVSPEKHKRGKKTANTALIYRVQEKGSSKNNVPARPTLVPTIEKLNKDEKVKALCALMTNEMGRKGIVDFAVFASNSVKDSIERIKKPKLRPATIRNRVNKGTTNPLVDTGQLKKSISWKLRK